MELIRSLVDQIVRMMKMTVVPTLTLPLKLLALVADTTTAIDSAMRRKTFRFGMCLLALGMVTCLLPLDSSVEIMRGHAPVHVGVRLAADTFDSTAPRSHGHLAALHNRRSFVSSSHTRQVTAPRMSRRSSILGNNPQFQLQRIEQSVELSCWFSNTITPVKASLEAI
jgi:hypothetical protein